MITHFFLSRNALFNDSCMHPKKNTPKTAARKPSSWFPCCCFWCRDKGSIEQPPVGLESLFKYSCMQQMIAPRDQTASRLCSRNYPVLPRCRCPSGPPTPSATRCFRRFCAPNRLHSTHRPANVPAAPWSSAPQARIGQKRQRILFHGPFTAVVLHFQ